MTRRPRGPTLGSVAARSKMAATQPPRSCVMPRFPRPGKRVFVLMAAVKAIAALVCAAALLGACRGREVRQATTRENAAPAGDIILVIIDTWRADAAGFAGNARVKTPFLDRLA